MTKDHPSSGFRASGNGGIAVPSRMQILEYLKRVGKPSPLEKMCIEFDLSSKDEINALQGRLERLTSQGILLLNRKKNYALVDKMNLLVGMVLGHANGFGFVRLDNGGEDLHLHHKQMRRVLHGDRVLARLKKTDHRGRKEGAIIEVLQGENRKIVGAFRKQRGVGFVEPDDHRFARDITIAKKDFNGAKNGDIVVVEITHHPIEHQHAFGEVIEIVGKDMAPGMEIEIAIRKHELPNQWPDEVEKQLDDLGDALTRASYQSSRVDLRQMPLVTIDGSDARDFDDAVFCEKKNKGWRLVVAIADVSHYVKVDSALDQEAYNRGTSVYFPNRVIPMLPEKLSNGICSLNPGEDRYCMVCDMQMDAKGNIRKYEFYPAMMHSHARLTYEMVNRIVCEKNHTERTQWASVVPHLDELYNLYFALNAQRKRRGAIDFEIPEPFIELDENNKINSITARSRNDAHKIIEECMLSANLCAGQYLQIHRNDNAVYRNHDGPDAESLTDLRRFLSGLGLTLSGSQSPQASDYSKLISSISGRDEIQGIVQTVLLRSLSQAVYSPDQIGHFALSFPIYTHFTSPIRRYSDLVCHRQIKQILSEKPAGSVAPNAVNFQQIGEQCSFTERRATEAGYDVIAWLKAEFMQERIGDEFDGTISGVKEFGIFVQLDEIFVDGLVHVTGLGNDYFHFDATQFQLKGERTGQQFRLGDNVRIKVVRVDLNEGKIDFELVDNISNKPSGNKSKAKRSGKKGKDKSKLKSGKTNQARGKSKNGKPIKGGSTKNGSTKSRSTKSAKKK